MGYCKIFPSGTVEVLEARLKKTKNSEQLRRIQTVYYRAKYNYLPVKISEMTGYAVGTVHNIHSDYLARRFTVFKLSRPGGRMAALMTPDEEAAFLRPFIKDGDSGQEQQRRRKSDFYLKLL